MSEIKDIVKNIVKDIEEKRASGQKDIHAVWKSCVKTKENEHTRVEGIKGNLLTVKVDCSAWMFQCRLRYKTILVNVQKEIPEIKRIYFKVGKVI